MTKASDIGGYSRRQFLKRGALWVSASALAPRVANATVALVINGKGKAVTTGNATVTLNTTGANLYVVVVCLYSTSAALATVSSTNNASGTWAHGSNYVNSTSNVCIFYCKSATASGAELFTINPNGTGYALAFVSAWSGADTSAPKDQDNGAANASGGTIQPGSITPGENNELVITGVSDNNNQTFTINSPFSTVTDTSQDTNSATGAWSYNIQTTATATNPTWTKGGGATPPKAAAIMSFKMAAAAGGARRRPTSVIQ